MSTIAPPAVGKAAKANAPARERRRRWRAWWDARHPPTETWTLTQRNVYILPTRAGLVFALTLLVMLVASINYQLALGYVLTFLLAGAGAASMHMTHNTLRGLTLRMKPPPPAFAGEPAAVEVLLDNPGRLRHGIGVGFSPRARESVVYVDVPALGQAAAHLRFVPAQRGWNAVPMLRVHTHFPFGLFHAWTVWRPAARLLAYPRPEQPVAPLPAVHAAGGDERPQRQAATSGEPDGVRAYRRGDALRSVVWKKTARTGELVSREHSAAFERELWLDWQATQVAGTEARLSRLAAWVIAADEAGVAHGLRLPGLQIEPAQGAAHRRRALEALALWS